VVKEFALAVGHNNAAGLQNIENLFFSSGVLIHYQPKAEIVPRGVERITLDLNSHYTGLREIRWSFSVLPFALFSLLVTTFLTDFTTASANVTLRTVGIQHTFANYNAVMVAPNPNEDYIRRGDYVLNLNLTFRIVADL
jgi:hypothetical protein